MNKCICKRGFYETATNVCTPCEEECSTCVEAGKCTACKG